MTDVLLSTDSHSGKAGLHIRHATPGRLRVAFAGIDDDRAGRCRRALLGIGGVRTVEINRLTESVLIHFDPAQTSPESLIESLARVRAGTDLAPEELKATAREGAGGPEPRSPEAPRARSGPASWFGRIVRAVRTFLKTILPGAELLCGFWNGGCRERLALLAKAAGASALERVRPTPPAPHHPLIALLDFACLFARFLPPSPLRTLLNGFGFARQFAII